MGADSLELFVSSLEEVLEVLVLPQLAQFFALQDPLGAGQVAGDVGSCRKTVGKLNSTPAVYYSGPYVPCMKANSTRRKKTVSLTESSGLSLSMSVQVFFMMDLHQT